MTKQLKSSSDILLMTLEAGNVIGVVFVFMFTVLHGRFYNIHLSLRRQENYERTRTKQQFSIKHQWITSFSFCGYVHTTRSALSLAEYVSQTMFLLHNVCHLLSFISQLSICLSWIQTPKTFGHFILFKKPRMIK